MDAEPDEHELAETKMYWTFQCLIQDLQDAINEFGYDAVYFGVGCVIFPEMDDGEE